MPGPLRQLRSYLPGPLRHLRTYLPGPLRHLRTNLPGPFCRLKTYLLGRLKEWCILIHIRIRCIIWWFALQPQTSQTSCFQPISFRKSTAFILSFSSFSAYFCSWVFYLPLFTQISKLGFYRKLKKATPKEIIFYLSNLKFSVKERIIWRKTKPTKCSFWFVHSQLIKELILKKLLNLNSKESRAIYLSETFMDQICKSSNSYGANRSRHNLKLKMNFNFKKWTSF